MSGIRDYIRDQVLGGRLAQKGVLAVYDPDQRYREICMAMGSEETLVVDAGDSGIEAREAASRALLAIGRSDPSPKQLLVYIPAAPPLTDEQRQVDPYSVYAVCGAQFPQGDGDEYMSLCLKAKPDHATEIRRLFGQDPSPSFDLIDGVGGGLKWPTLRHVLGVESARDILFALLAPSEKQSQALKDNEAWVGEARDLLSATLGLKLATRGKTWSSIADELWRFLLFSEFAFDLPEDLPAALGSVPRAHIESQPLVEGLCEQLRSDRRSRQAYIDRAEFIEKDLDLGNLCRSITDLGVLDTFPFEERTFLANAVRALCDDKLDDVRQIIGHHRHSVWTGKGESQAQWGFVEAALQLVEACDDAERQLSDHAKTLDSLIGYYATGLYEVDRRHREFEQVAADILSLDGAMEEALEHGRRGYAKIVEKVQRIFTQHVETGGWPPQGFPSNSETYDRLIDPLLKERGNRVAYIMVDALRFELGLTLHRQLAETDQADIVPVSAQLPTITPVGMTSLLPGATKDLSIDRDDDALKVSLAGTKITTVAHRMDSMRAILGDRFAEMTLDSYIRTKDKLAENVDLLVLRSVDIDSHLENNATATLGLIPQTLKGIRIAINKLKKEGFANVIIATDHGFALNAHAEAGDVCVKPTGNWVVVHDRALLGDGGSDAHNFAISAEKAGIRGDFTKLAGPKSMAPYRKGLEYFHGGVSLQEAIVPILSVKLGKTEQPGITSASVILTYKNGAKKITTRLPVVDLGVESSDMFSLESDVEILLEARDRKGEIVGEAKPGGSVDAATGTISLKPGQTVQVTIRMNMDFEGKFTLKAFNPITMAQYASLDLETDYAV